MSEIVNDNIRGLCSESFCSNDYSHIYETNFQDMNVSIPLCASCYSKIQDIKYKQHCEEIKRKKIEKINMIERYNLFLNLLDGYNETKLIKKYVMQMQLEMNK